ncbi:MAG: hypothetical protein ACM319_07775 [Deltaproteobacteria bacterium]|nr:hypothetical protein [Candidatus Deferrimicrobiaceae bacterium]
MVRKYFLALSILAAFFMVAAGSAQAGWGHSYDSTAPGQSMSSEPAAPESSTSSSEQQTQSMESSDYQKEEAVETGKLPESRGFESDEPAATDVAGVLYRGGIDAGP